MHACTHTHIPHTQARTHACTHHTHTHAHTHTHTQAMCSTPSQIPSSCTSCHNSSCRLERHATPHYTHHHLSLTVTIPSADMSLNLPTTSPLSQSTTSTNRSLITSSSPPMYRPTTMRLGKSGCQVAFIGVRCWKNLWWWAKETRGCVEQRLTLNTRSWEF